MMIVFGLNKFLNFIDPPALDAAAGAYFAALASAKVFTVVGILEIATGLAFLTGRYMGLAVILNAAIAFNVLLFHLTLNMAGIAPAAVWIVLLIIIFIGVKDKFSEIFKP